MSVRADRRNRRILAALPTGRARELLALKQSIETGSYLIDDRPRLVVDSMIDDVARPRARETP